MRFLVLSRRRHLYATRRLRESAKRLSHELTVIDPWACTVVLAPPRLRLYHGDREIEDVDCAIPRIGPGLAGYGVSVVSHLESMGVPTLGRAEAIARAGDKLLTLEVLARNGIDVPRTVLVRGPERLDRTLDLLGGPPVVLKLLQGSQGIGVILAETRTAIEATLDTLWGLGQDILLQEFIAESRGQDLRVLIVGDRVVAAMRRQARSGEWRSNLHRGGSGSRVDLHPRYESAAIGAARAIGLEVAGIDILESARGPKVIEVNASPGFEGLEQTTGIDVATTILRHAEEFARRKATLETAAGFSI